MKVITLNTYNENMITQSICSAIVISSIPKGYYCKTAKSYAMKLYDNGRIHMRAHKKKIK